MTASMDDFRIVRQFEVWRPLTDGRWAPEVACETYAEAQKYAPPGYRIVEQYELRHCMFDGVERRILAKDTYAEAEEAMQAEVNPTQDLKTHDIEQATDIDANDLLDDSK